MAYQSKVPVHSGTFSLREFKGRWGAYHFPAGTAPPADIEPFRLFDIQAIKKHLEDNFSRAEMLNKAEALGVAVTSSSGSKPTKSSVAHAMACFLSKPLDPNYEADTRPYLGVKPTFEENDDKHRFIESLKAELEKCLPKKEVKKMHKQAMVETLRMFNAPTEDDKKLLGLMQTMSPADIIKLKKLALACVGRSESNSGTESETEPEDNRNIRYIRVVVSNIPRISPNTAIILCKADESVYESKLRLFTDIFNEKDAEALAVSLSFVRLGSSEGIDNHATWGRVDTEGDGVVEVVAAALENEYTKQFFAGSFCVQLVETGRLHDELSLNEKKANTKTLTIKVPTEKGDVRLYYYYTPKDTFHEVFECIDNIVGIYATEFTLKWVASPSVLERWEPIEATLCDAPFCVLTIAMRGGGKRPKKKADDADMMPIKVKQLLSDNIVRLKSLTGSGEAIQNVLAEVEKIVKNVADNPATPVSSMFDTIPVSKKASILSSTIGHSTRADERVEFIAEQVLSEMMERLSEQERMTALAKKTLCLAVRYAIHSEFQDAKGDIGWQQMMKALADKMAEPVSETSGNRCLVM